MQWFFGHNMLMVGSPGNGKTLLARALPGILPEMCIEESLDVTRIYSVADQLPSRTPLIKHRPFRSPHHTISHTGLAGRLDTISMGPTIKDLHSPDERLYIPSLSIAWDFLKTLLISYFSCLVYPQSNASDVAYIMHMGISSAFKILCSK